MTTLRAFLSILVLLAALPATGAEPFVAARFSAAVPGAGAPEGWQPLLFSKVERETDYRLVEDGGAVVMRADSRDAASGMFRAVQLDPRAFPTLEWRWKVAAPVPGVIGKRDADDFAARVYVGFAKDPDSLGTWERLKLRVFQLFYGRTPPLAALNYVWADGEPVDTVAPSPFTDRVRLVVVGSGGDQAGEWVRVRRDLVADFRRAFGEEPPTVTDVGIMTDTDNTGAAATAFYGDIVFYPARRP